MNQDPDYRDIQIASLFSLPAGTKTLEVLKDMLGVEQTIEPAEEHFILTGNYSPVDPIGMAIRKGRRDAYYLIKNAITRGDNAVRKVADES